MKLKKSLTTKGCLPLYQTEPQRDLACMVFLGKKELSLIIPHYSSEDRKLEPLTEKRSVERLDLIWSYVMQTWSQQTVHHEGDHFSNSTVNRACRGGVSPFPHGISLHGSLVVRFGAKGIIFLCWESFISFMCAKRPRTVLQLTWAGIP